MARQSKGITLPIIYKADLKGLKDAESGLEKFGRVAGRIGLAAAGALAGVVGAGVKMAADLETTFSQIQGLVGLSADEVGELEEAAKRLGPEFGKSAKEAADALFFITSSGLRGADAVDTLEAALKGSAIGLGDITAIANTATGAMNTYGADVLSGAEAVDALAEAVRLGQFAPEELAGSLGQVTSISNELGISFQETTGLVAALTKQSIPASQAVTGIRGAMQAFLKPSAEAERVLNDFGISISDVRDSIQRKGFLATLIDLRERFGDNEDAITRVFGSIEGLNAAYALTGEAQATSLDIINQMTDGLGILDEAYAVTEETVSQKFAVAMETIKGIMLEIGEAVLPIVSDLLSDLAPIIGDAAAAVSEFIDTDLGPWIAGLQANEDFQNFLTTMRDLFTDTVPQVADLVLNVANLATNITTLLKPALDEIVGEEGIMFEFGRILDEINYWLTQLNTLQVPGFQSSLEDALNVVGQSLTPLGTLRVRFKQIADALTAIRQAWEKLRDSGFRMLGGPSLGGRSTGGPTELYQGGLNEPRAAGGSVMGGNSYLVGERGPEMFVPRMSGTIVPTHRLGGGAPINIVVNAGMGTNGADVGREIVAAIRRYERTSGRVFASA